ncbi:MAG: hypothetical protein AB1782_03830, partial [Cyanobacteriota bacterium]
MKTIIPKLISVLLFFFALNISIQQIATAKVDVNLQDRYEVAKMNLVIGETNKAKQQFLDLEKVIVEDKNKSDDMKKLYSEVMYNLGLTYEQKYEDESGAETLEGASSDDLLQANQYFEKADPKIFEEVAYIGDIKFNSETRAVGGIVGKVIKGKVKDWLKQAANCNCTF